MTSFTLTLLKTINQGLEQATSKNKNQQKEEEEERRAAELEKKKRASVSSATPIGVDPPLRRYKILLLGDSGVGKSSLICRWTLDSFSATLLGTVGVDFKAKKVNIENENFQIQVWDTAGQEQFHKITTSYYKGANGIMLVYDVTDEKSANEVGYWMKNIKSHAADNVAVVMVANKADLLYGKESVILTAGKNNARKYEVPHFITSAKDSSGVDDAFISLVKLIVNSDASMKPKSHLAHQVSNGPKLAPGVDPTKSSLSSSSLSTIFRGGNKSRECKDTTSDSTSITGEGGKTGKEKCTLS